MRGVHWDKYNRGGAWEDPLQPPQRFTSLSRHPSAARSAVRHPLHLPLNPSSLSLYPFLNLFTTLRSLFSLTLPFISLTSSSYSYPYHYLLHCRHLAQQLGITSCSARAECGSEIQGIRVWTSRPRPKPLISLWMLTNHLRARCLGKQFKVRKESVCKDSLYGF